MYHFNFYYSSLLILIFAYPNITYTFYILLKKFCNFSGMFLSSVLMISTTLLKVKDINSLINFAIYNLYETITSVKI